MLQHLDPGFTLDPHPLWDRLRAEDPALHLADVDAWLLTGYTVVREALRDPRLSPSPRYWKHHQPPAPGAPVSQRERFFASGLFNAPPQDHTRLRRHLSRAFTPQAVERQGPFVDQLCARLLHEASSAEPVELMGAFCSVLPVLTMCNLVGFPGELAADFKRVADVLVHTIEPTTDPAVDARIDAAFNELEAIIEVVTRERRAAPSNDLLSGLLEVEADGDRLSHLELVGLVASMIIAGSTTVANLLGHGVIALLEHPDQLGALRADPSLIAGAVEEIARWCAIGFGATHFAMEPTVVGGHAVAPGDLVVVAVGAANHDAAVFADPHRFDIGRAPQPTMAFGIGAHYCIGAALARLQIERALEALLDAGPSLTLAGVPQYEGTMLFRNVSSLPVRLR